MVATTYKHLLCMFYEWLHLLLLIIESVLLSLFNTWKQWNSENAEKHA